MSKKSCTSEKRATKSLKLKVLVMPKHDGDDDVSSTSSSSTKEPKTSRSYLSVVSGVATSVGRKIGLIQENPLVSLLKRDNQLDRLNALVKILYSKDFDHRKSDKSVRWTPARDTLFEFCETIKTDHSVSPLLLIPVVHSLSDFLVRTQPNCRPSKDIKAFLKSITQKITKKLNETSIDTQSFWCLFHNQELIFRPEFMYPAQSTICFDIWMTLFNAFSRQLNPAQPDYNEFYQLLENFIFGYATHTHFKNRNRPLIAPATHYIYTHVMSLLANPEKNVVLGPEFNYYSQIASNITRKQLISSIIPNESIISTLNYHLTKFSIQISESNVLFDIFSRILFWYPKIYLRSIGESQFQFLFGKICEYYLNNNPVNYTVSAWIIKDMYFFIPPPLDLGGSDPSELLEQTNLRKQALIPVIKLVEVWTQTWRQHFTYPHHLKSFVLAIYSFHSVFSDEIKTHFTLSKFLDAITADIKPGSETQIYFPVDLSLPEPIFQSLFDDILTQIRSSYTISQPEPHEERLLKHTWPFMLRNLTKMFPYSVMRNFDNILKLIKLAFPIFSYEDYSPMETALKTLYSKFATHFPVSYNNEQINQLSSVLMNPLGSSLNSALSPLLCGTIFGGINSKYSDSYLWHLKFSKELAEAYNNHQLETSNNSRRTEYGMTFNRSYSQVISTRIQKIPLSLPLGSNPQNFVPFLNSLVSKVPQNKLPFDIPTPHATLAKWLNLPQVRKILVKPDSPLPTISKAQFAMLLDHHTIYSLILEKILHKQLPSFDHIQRWNAEFQANLNYFSSKLTVSYILSNVFDFIDSQNQNQNTNPAQDRNRAQNLVSSSFTPSSSTSTSKPFTLFQGNKYFKIPLLFPKSSYTSLLHQRNEGTLSYSKVFKARCAELKEFFEIYDNPPDWDHPISLHQFIVKFLQQKASTVIYEIFQTNLSLFPSPLDVSTLVQLVRSTIAKITKYGSDDTLISACAIQSTDSGIDETNKMMKEQVTLRELYPDLDIGDSLKKVQRARTLCQQRKTLLVFEELFGEFPDLQPHKLSESPIMNYFQAQEFNAFTLKDLPMLEKALNEALRFDLSHSVFYPHIFGVSRISRYFFEKKIFIDFETKLTRATENANENDQNSLLSNLRMFMPVLIFFKSHFNVETTVTNDIYDLISIVQKFPAEKAHDFQKLSESISTIQLLFSNLDASPISRARRQVEHQFPKLDIIIQTTSYDNKLHVFFRGDIDGIPYDFSETEILQSRFVLRRFQDNLTDVHRKFESICEVMFSVILPALTSLLHAGYLHWQFPLRVTKYADCDDQKLTILGKHLEKDLKDWNQELNTIESIPDSKYLTLISPKYWRFLVSNILGSISTTSQTGDRHGEPNIISYLDWLLAPTTGPPHPLTNEFQAKYNVKELASNQQMLISLLDRPDVSMPSEKTRRKPGNTASRSAGSSPAQRYQNSMKSNKSILSASGSSSSRSNFSSPLMNNPLFDPFADSPKSQAKFNRIGGIPSDDTSPSTSTSSSSSSSSPAKKNPLFDPFADSPKSQTKFNRIGGIPSDDTSPSTSSLLDATADPTFKITLTFLRDWFKCRYPTLGSTVKLPQEKFSPMLGKKVQMYHDSRKFEKPISLIQIPNPFAFYAILGCIPTHFNLLQCDSSTKITDLEFFLKKALYFDGHFLIINTDNLMSETLKDFNKLLNNFNKNEGSYDRTGRTIRGKVIIEYSRILERSDRMCLTSLTLPTAHPHHYLENFRVISGPDGSGKTFWIENQNKNSKIHRITLDEQFSQESIDTPPSETVPAWTSVLSAPLYELTTVSAMNNIESFLFSLCFSHLISLNEGNSPMFMKPQTIYFKVLDTDVQDFKKKFSILSIFSQNKGYTPTKIKPADFGPLLQPHLTDPRIYKDFSHVNAARARKFGEFRSESLEKFLASRIREDRNGSGTNLSSIISHEMLVFLQLNGQPMDAFPWSRLLFSRRDPLNPTGNYTKISWKPRN